MSLLPSIFLVPLLAALLIAFVPRNFRLIIRLIALAATFVSMLLAVKLFYEFNGATADVEGFRFVSTLPWLGAASLGIACKVGVDGLNIGLILMGAVVAFAATCVSREIKKNEKEFYILLLVMAGGILGAFVSLDLFFFYFFHELALVPTFIMIGVWGRGEDKNYATFKITIYLSLGALLALIGLTALYLQLPPDARTFDITEITRYFAVNPMALDAQHLIFPLLLFGFGILVSLWPFHTWAPLGYGSAPTATAMLHAGVLKKFGLYGLIRVALPLMPEAAKSWLHVIAFLCLGNILYCGWVAMRQKNLNLLIGNSSVAHMGFCFLGIASLSLIGITGTVMVMVAHGLLAALTFALSGYLFQKTGTLRMDEMGGMLRRLPFAGTLFILAAFAGCGLPGFANFAGEALVLFGAWKSFTLVTVFAIWGASVIGAVYMLRAVRAIWHGPEQDKWNSLKDVGVGTSLPTDWLWHKLPYALLLTGLLIFGFAPRLLTDKIKPSAQTVVELATRAPVAVAGKPAGLAVVETNLK